MLMALHLLKRWLSRIMTICDDRLCDVRNRHHSTRAQLMAFKAAIHYSHYGCFFPPYPVEGEYIPDFNTYDK